MPRKIMIQILMAIQAFVLVHNLKKKLATTRSVVRIGPNCRQRSMHNRNCKWLLKIVTMHTAEIKCKVPVHAQKTSYGIYEFN